VYLDIKETFDAPIINWVFRSLMANDPDLTRYLWGQVKPIFLTKKFASFAVAYRDTVLSAVEESSDIPKYEASDLGISPAEYRELRRQLRTFDTVAPRLSLFFEVVYRGLHDDLEMTTPTKSASYTAPYTQKHGERRGGSPTMIAATNIPDELEETINALQTFHGIENGIPSIHRCLAQWPTVLQVLWRDVSPLLRGPEFETAQTETSSLLSTHASEIGYFPNINPKGLQAVGFEQSRIDAVTDFMNEFYHGPADTVLLTLPIYATTVNASGRRAFP
jgi:hypothetical protein